MVPSVKLGCAAVEGPARPEKKLAVVKVVTAVELA
jgi:hypothetical protein